MMEESRKKEERSDSQVEIVMVIFVGIEAVLKNGEEHVWERKY